VEEPVLGFIKRISGTEVTESQACPEARMVFVDVARTSLSTTLLASKDWEH